MKILFVHNALQTFVRIDRDILAAKYPLAEIDFHWRPSSVTHLLAELRNCDVVFSWFASHHTLLPAVLGHLLGKKVIVCAADYDIGNEPHWFYNTLRSRLRRLVNDWIFRATDIVLVTSHFAYQLALQNTILKGMPNKMKMLYLGLAETPVPTLPKEALVITIGSPEKRLTIFRKGLDQFVRMATYIPNISCGLIGSCSGPLADELRAEAPPNVHFWGRLPDADRDHMLARAEAYAQLSFMEGFGLAVAEAMLQKCVPVVTRNGSLPEVVGDTGIYVPFNAPQAAAEGVRQAIQRPELGHLARERVLDMFPLQQRASQIYDMLDNL